MYFLPTINVPHLTVVYTACIDRTAISISIKHNKMYRYTLQILQRQ